MTTKGLEVKRAYDLYEEKSHLVIKPKEKNNKNKEYVQIQTLQSGLDTDKTYHVLLFSSIFLHITLYLWLFLKNGPLHNNLLITSTNFLVLIAFTMTFYTVGLVALQLKTTLLQKVFLFMSFLAIFLNLATIVQFKVQNPFYALFILLLLVQNAALSFKAYAMYKKFKEIQDLNELYLIVNKPNTLC